MKDELSDTLGELERKLQELERTLATMGHSDAPAQQAHGAEGTLGAAWEESPSGQSRLIDEAIEHDSTIEPDRAGGREDTDDWDEEIEWDGPPSSPSDAAPPVQPSSPVQPGLPAAQPPAPGPSGFPAAQPPAPGPPGFPAAQPAAPVEPPMPAGRPAARSPAQPRPAAELLRFRERLERTAPELTHDYDDLLGRLRSSPTPAPAVGTISFARGAPSLDIVDVDGLRHAAERAFTSDPGGTTAYGTSVGYPRLRAWIADRHGVEPERVLVTNGSMQADAFLFDHLVRPRDEVVVERPTYDRTLLALQQRGARLRPVMLQPDGIDIDALARLLTGGTGARPKLAHIIPNFQNPAGYTLSLPKRGALLALAAQYGFVVFEDDPYVALRFSGESLPTMLSMDPERVVYASSFSKTVCPGIRVGYLVGPRHVIDAVAQLATNTYISPNMVAQSIVYEFCASGAIERSIETVRRALAERAARLAAALRRELPDAEFVAPDGGYFMWVTLPPGTDVASLHAAAAELGVSFVKGTDFVLKRGENTLRLAYAGVTPEQIDEGVARLAAAYRSLA